MYVFCKGNFFYAQNKKNKCVENGIKRRSNGRRPKGTNGRRLKGKPKPIGCALKGQHYIARGNTLGIKQKGNPTP